MQDWLDLALCKGSDSWTDDDRATRATAARTCLRCPSLPPCQEFAAQFRWSEVAVAARTFGPGPLPYERGRPPNHA